MRRAISSFIVLCALATQARAIPYESFIDVDDEGDLQDLLASQAITDDTFAELLDLLDRGVDLATADRNDLYALPNLTYDDVDAIIAYRSLQRGRINDPSELVTAGAITQDKLLAISAFLIVRKAADNPLAAHAWVRAATRMTQRDMVAHDIPYQPESRFYPPLALRARVTAQRYLTAGFALTTTRLEIGDPVYDPQRNALIAEPAGYQVHLPKAYVRWETNSFNVMLGSFRAGFAQRLVFDNSRHYSPNGLYADDQVFFDPDLSSVCKESGGELLTSPCTGPAGDEYVTPDFVWRDGLFGAAAGFKKLELSTGWLQGYAFASASRRSVYQYELVDKKACEDPHNDADPACTAPEVFVRQGDLLSPSPRYSFETLPNVFQERLVGGNFSYFADRRNSIGVTAYGANEVNLIDGIDLSTQEWSRFPNGNKFGAAGANFSFGRGIVDVFGEAATSFDAMKITDTTATPAKGGGGPAALLRLTVTPTKKEELEVVGRYFSTDYANPYSRPISEADEFEGDRARDEAGTRIRYIKMTKELVIRALADVWVNPSGGETTDKTGKLITSGPKVDTYVRANVKTTPTVWLGLWERYQDKDLSRGGHDQCFEVSNTTDESGEPIPCGGRQLTTIVRASYEPNRRYSGQLLLEHQLLDDNTQPMTEARTKFRQDVAAWFIGYLRWTDDLHVRLRMRYLNEAINDSAFLETSFAAKMDVLTRVRERDSLRVRLEGKWWLDDRDSTVARNAVLANGLTRLLGTPEVSLWLFYDARL